MQVVTNRQPKPKQRRAPLSVYAHVVLAVTWFDILYRINRKQGKTRITSVLDAYHRR